MASTLWNTVENYTNMFKRVIRLKTISFNLYLQKNTINFFKTKFNRFRCKWGVKYSTSLKLRFQIKSNRSFWRFSCQLKSWLRYNERLCSVTLLWSLILVSHHCNGFNSSFDSTEKSPSIKLLLWRHQCRRETLWKDNNAA
jgi:hypothetical protein